MMDGVTTFGLVAAVCTTASFVPQAVKTIKTQDTTSISLVMYLLFTFGTLMWLIYGLLSNNMPVILANAITLLLASTILYFKMRHQNKTVVFLF